jgi:hypothetical protein
MQSESIVYEYDAMPGSKTDQEKGTTNETEPAHAALSEDYNACAHYSESRFKCLNGWKFKVLRFVLNVPALFVAAITWYYDPLKVQLLTYESEWGVLFTAVSSILMFLAEFDREIFQESAVITQ